MLTLNRKSEVYQHLFNNAMTRLNRVPKELLEPLTEPTPKYAATLAPYVFERDELDFQVAREGSRGTATVSFGEYFAPRITQNQAVAYDRQNSNWFTMPMEVYFGGEVLASLMWVVFNRRPGHRLPFDLRTAAHRAVLVYTHSIVGAGNTIRNNQENTFFSPRTERLREEFLVAKFLNGNDPKTIDQLIARQEAKMVGGAPHRELSMVVRIPVQSSQPIVGEGFQFNRFPYSYNEYSDVFNEAILDIFVSYTGVEAGENDQHLAAQLIAEFGSAEQAVKTARIACFNRWLNDDEVGPLKAREAVKEELWKYRAAFAAVYRVEMARTIEIEF